MIFDEKTAQYDLRSRYNCRRRAFAADSAPSRHFKKVPSLLFKKVPSFLFKKVPSLLFF